MRVSMYSLLSRNSRNIALAATLLAVSSCAPGDRLREVTVVGTDYAFQVPESVPAGPTAFAFENRGRVDHELLISLLKPGATLQQALDAESAGRDAGEFLESASSVLYAEPGESSTARLLLDLIPGRTYAVVCLMRDAEQAPPHAAMGMVTSFTVE